MKIYGLQMKEKILKFEKSKIKGKKYTAYIINKDTNKIHKINFGAIGYEQYKDSTNLKCYSKYDHNDINRKYRYYARHSNGIKTKIKATQYEIKKSNGYFNAKILSHLYLW